MQKRILFLGIFSLFLATFWGASFLPFSFSSDEGEELLKANIVKKETFRAIAISKSSEKSEENTFKKAVFIENVEPIKDDIQDLLLEIERKKTPSVTSVVISEFPSVQTKKDISENFAPKNKTEEIIECNLSDREIPKSLLEDFKKATRDIPCRLLWSLEKVEIFEDVSGKSPRALASGKKIRIRKDTPEKSEFEQILIHELGHVLDLGGLQGNLEYGISSFKDGSNPIFQNDISVIFYEISWANEKTKKEGITDFDFVGGYAAHDPFEDFAESFLYYIKHGQAFRLLSEGNPILEEKYNFFKEFIFKGKEFDSGESFVNPEKRVWDITKL